MKNEYGVANLKTYMLEVDTMFRRLLKQLACHFFVIRYKNLSLLQPCFALLICSCCNNVLCLSINFYPKPYQFRANFNLSFINYEFSKLCFFKKQSFWSISLNPTVSYYSMYLLLTNLDKALEVFLNERPLKLRCKE